MTAARNATVMLLGWREVNEPERRPSAVVAPSSGNDSHTTRISSSKTHGRRDASRSWR
jgi:hypothetical protein